MVQILKMELASCLDPLQWLHNTEDVVISVTLLINKHLKIPAAHGFFLVILALLLTQNDLSC